MATMTKTGLEVNIWAESLYNPNIGGWFTLPMDEEELAEVMDKLTLGGQHDYEIMDYEAPFRIGRFENLVELNELVQQLEELMLEHYIDEEELEALLQYADSVEEAIQLIKDGAVHFYHLDNTWDGWKELAEILVIDHGWLDVPEHLIDYIDYERLGYSLSCEGNWHIHEGIAVHVIW